MPLFRKRLAKGFGYGVLMPDLHTMAFYFSALHFLDSLLISALAWAITKSLNQQSKVAA